MVLLSGQVQVVWTGAIPDAITDVRQGEGANVTEELKVKEGFHREAPSCSLWR